LLAIIEYTVTAIVCLISAVVIQRIFVKEQEKGIGTASAQGIKWFGFAIFAWGIGAVGNLIGTEVFGSSHKITVYWGVFISLANSLFILLSLPSIEHSKSRGLGVRLVERFSTKEFITLYCGVLGMIVFVFFATSFTNTDLSSNFTWLIDIPISIFVAISLLFELNKAFSARQMKFMYLPTCSLFVLIVIAVSHRIIPQDQVVNIIDQEFWSLVGGITAISFKFLFILLFSILLYSWKFLSEKELQQSLAQTLSSENVKLKHELRQLTIANESHLDTIKNIKTEMNVLVVASKIELSDRQKEVLANLAFFGSKRSYPELAQEMHISLDGLQTHIHQIKKILNISGVGGKEQLIAFAKQNNLLQYASVSKPS
jgi:DNA-binding CsgD family transcriptional regulator